MRVEPHVPSEPIMPPAFEPRIVPIARPIPGFDPAETDARPARALPPIRQRWAAILIAAGPVVGVIGALVDTESPVLVVAVLSPLAGVLLALVNAIRALVRVKQVTGRELARDLGLSALTALSGVIASASAVAMTVGSGRGRQLRIAGRPQHAELAEDTAWITALGATDGLEREAAEAWRQNGLTEHASVAAFAELSMELIALGAPPRLIEAAHRDALDELRHTTLCFELAQRLDGRTLGPRDLPQAARMRPRPGPRSLRLAHLAVTSLFDGALYEGLSARVVSSLARGPLDPRVRPVIEAIARDEARHAAHGFDVVRWCLAEGGPPVARALEVAIDRIRRQPPHALGTVENERLGLPRVARQAAAWRVIRDRTVARTERLLGSVETHARS